MVDSLLNTFSSYSLFISFKDANYRWACGIEMEEKVIITGGALNSGLVASDKAIVYNDDGFVEDLPSLRLGRWGHGCGHYITDNTNGNRV